MITLDDITLYPFILSLKDQMQQNPKYLSLYTFLVENKIYDFGRLEFFLRNGHPDANTDDFKRMLEKARNTIFRINTKNQDAQMYYFETDVTDPRSLELMQNTDESTSFSDILVRHPVFSNTLPFKTNWCRVDLAKYLIGKLNVSGNNALASMIMDAGKKRIDAFSWNIEFYDTQLERTLKTTPSDFDGNLFLKDREEKEKAIAEEFAIIVNYFLHNGKKFVWGNLTKSAKDALEKAISNPGVVRDTLIRVLSNYVTLEEAEQGLVRSRVIDRFILK